MTHKEFRRLFKQGIAARAEIMARRDVLLAERDALYDQIYSRMRDGSDLALRLLKTSAQVNKTLDETYAINKRLKLN